MGMYSFFLPYFRRNAAGMKYAGGFGISQTFVEQLLNQCLILPASTLKG
jgi:hypothetical protein